MITRMLSSLVRASRRSAGPRPRVREVARPPLRLERLEQRCDICGVLPTALDDEYWATADELLTVLPSGVLANDGLGAQGGPEDTDPCGTTLSAVLVDGPTEGTLSLNSDGSLTFTKDSVGAVTFTYIACDELNYCSTVATVTIMVQPKAGKVSFTQYRNPPFIPGVGPYGQPGAQSTGGYYGDSEITAHSPPAWATSWVQIWGPGAVCNSGPSADTGRLRAYVVGSKGATYTVDMQIDVAVSTTSAANDPYAMATITDLTGTYTPALLGTISTTPAQSWANFSMAVTVTTTITTNNWAPLIEINPTMCGTGPAGTADFVGTIYVSAITP